MAQRPQTLTCRPDPAKYPDLVPNLTAQAKAAGMSLNAYLPELLAGLANPAAQKQSEYQQRIDELERQLATVAGTGQNLESARAELATQLEQKNALIEQLQQKLAGQAGEQRIHQAQAQELADLRTERVGLLAEVGTLNARIGRIIDLAVKNSFVSRKKYESL
ncbi:hypothetical protein ACAW74_18240 [Fibrella sp. WM1]|uniref:hypothetical protein n=1 Tax=Fibrella musci TaxID=3242485 RepID=UPI00352245DF